MDEHAAVPRRERRHRKAAAGGGGAAAARAAYGDVFGGPPRFAAPFAGVPEDYAEVFGGVAASCSIPFLDLPPAAAAAGDGGGGAGDYCEIFGRFDFGDFAVSYEELFEAAEREREREEIASSSGSSQSSTKKESSQLEAEASILLQNYANEDHDEHFEEDQFSPISFPSNGGQHFNMSYNKTSWGRPDDPVVMTTCIVEPSVDYVVDSCNSSHNSATNHVPRMDNDTMANGEKGKSPSSASASVKSPGSDFIADQKQHMPACPPISGNGHANENHQKCSSSNHSASSDEAPSTDYPFLRVSDISLQTRPIKVPPPSRPPPKLLNKQDTTVKGDTYLVNHTGTPTTSGQGVSSSNMLQAASKADPPSFDLDVNPSSAAAAAMKEAMEFAEARLKAAKELMGIKGESFKLRKRPGHHRSTKSTEIKESKTPEEVHTFEEKLSLKKSAKEDKNYEDLTLPDKHRKVSSVNLVQCDDKERTVLLLDEPQQMMQSGFGSYQASSKLEKLGKWRSGDEFYELISHDQGKTNAAVREEDNGKRTNPAIKLSKDGKGKTGVTAGNSDIERYEKLWEDNDSKELGVKHVNLREDGATCMESEDNAPTIIPEAFTLTENIANQEVHVSHFEGHVRAGNAQENHDGDEKVGIPSLSEISPKVNCLLEMSSSFSEASTSGDHANDLRDLGNPSSEESLVVEMPQEDNGNKVGLKMPSVGETVCISEGTKKLQEPPEISNLDHIQASQVKTAKFEEAAESYENQAFQRGLSTSDGQAETCEKEKLFSFDNEACMQNENEKVIEVPTESLIYKGVEKFETEKKGGLCEDSEQIVVDWDAECPEKENDISLENSSLANEHEELEELNVFEVASKLIESNSRKSGIFHKDPDQLQEMQGSLESQELENRTEAGADFVCDGKEKEAKEASLENSEKTAVAEILSHGSREDQTASKTDSDKGSSELYGEANAAIDGEGNVALHSRDEFITDAAKDVPMRMSKDSKDQHASFPEMCSSMQHSSQNAMPVSAETSEKTTLGPLNLEEDCEKQTLRELLTEKSIRFEEEKKRGSKMEKKEDRERVSNIELKDQQSPHSETGATIPKLADDTASVFVETSRNDPPGVQRTEEMENKRKIEREIEKEKEVSRRLEEEKERERKLEKEREQAKERERRKLEEEKEREREREKDRLAVERATREAHERAFAEARERAERIALERITAARQRGSAEAREKEEKANAEAAAEKASREARIKAERAAVERATAEARERAIEKAKAEKAAADARERMERFRSSFKESFKAANQDIRQDTQFQRTTSNNYGRNTDSSNQVVEVESALRHKARLERHQRTAERAAKALTEKNLRDMLAQREQAERHRLAEFLDPEVKRWSNGKEGNLRALLSTLQYILGAESGWQPVPLTDLITAPAVKKAYRRATLCVHPDKLQQRGATVRQKYICEKVFDLLKEAWNKFNSEER